MEESWCSSLSSSAHWFDHPASSNISGVLRLDATNAARTRCNNVYNHLSFRHKFIDINQQHQRVGGGSSDGSSRDDGNLGETADDNKRDACLSYVLPFFVLQNDQLPYTIYYLFSARFASYGRWFSYRGCVISFLIKITHIRKTGTGNGLHLDMGVLRRNDWEDHDTNGLGTANPLG